MSDRAPHGLRATHEAMPHPLDRVLRPGSVAIVGASADPTKRGHRALRALLDAGYRGRVVPVHPSGGELLGVPVLRGPADLSTPPDLVLVCTPASTVPRILEEWAEAGAGGAVVLAVGFGESGAEGRRLESEVTAVARRTGLRVVGPNTSGILNVPMGLNLIGLEGARAGPLALLVQSGNVALALVTQAARVGPGFTFVIGVGNEADLTFDEYLDFLRCDPETKGVAVHAEGFRSGRAFLHAVARAAAVKPVVVLKGGRTGRGGAAARSHTGAVTGSYDAFRAGLRQTGAVEVTRSDEILPTLTALAGQPELRRIGGVAVLSDGGGHATLAVDDLHVRGTPLARLARRTSEELRALLGPAAAVENPVDLAGAADRDPRVFARAFEILARDPDVAAVLMAGLFGGYALRFDASLRDREEEAARRLSTAARQAGVGLVVHSLYAAMAPDPLGLLQGAGIPVVDSLEVACRSIDALVGLARSAGPREAGSWAVVERTAELRRAPSTRGPAGIDELQQARREGRAVLLETEVRALVEPFGLSVVPAVACRTAAEAGSAARAFATAVVIRVLSPDAPHKSDVGGVVLGVAPPEAEEAAARLLDAVHSRLRDRGTGGAEPDLRGVLVSPMLPPPTAELLVGVRRDPQFGPVLTVGAGGTGVEWLRDTATRILPVTAAEIHRMLSELRIAPLLDGYRGAAPVDRVALVDAILALSACALANEEIAEMEINPLFASPEDAVAVDLRAFLV